MNDADKTSFIDSVKILGENWKEIQGYRGLYYVSSLGRVLSFHNQNKPLFLKVTECIDRGKSYGCVCLSIDAVWKKIRVHKLVAAAFLDNPNGYTEIDHINGDGTDNRASNLRFCDHRSNVNNPITRMRRNVKVIRRKEGEPDKVYHSVLSTETDGFTATNVCAVCRGVQKTHKGYKWFYATQKD